MFRYQLYRQPYEQQGATYQYFGQENNLGNNQHINASTCQVPTQVLNKNCFEYQKTSVSPCSTVHNYSEKKSTEENNLTDLSLRKENSKSEIFNETLEEHRPKRFKSVDSLCSYSTEKPSTSTEHGTQITGT